MRKYYLKTERDQIVQDLVKEFGYTFSAATSMLYKSPFPTKEKVLYMDSENTKGGGSVIVVTKALVYFTPEDVQEHLRSVHRRKKEKAVKKKKPVQKGIYAQD